MAWGADHGDVAAQICHDGLDNGEAEARAAGLPRATLFDAPEAVKDVFEVRRRDADAGVDDGNGGQLFVACDVDVDAATVFVIDDGIADDVAQGDVEEIAISPAVDARRVTAG